MSKKKPEEIQKEFSNLPEVPVQAELPAKEKSVKKGKNDSEKEVVERKTKKNLFIDVIKALNERYSFRYNEFTAYVEFKALSAKDYKEFDERDFNNLLMWLRITMGLNITDSDFRTLIGSDQISEGYNPINEYLYSLPAWDKKDYFGDFLSQIELVTESQRPYFVKCFKKWFVALVASLVSDRVVNDNIMVFVGEQGVRKSTFLNNLVPAHLLLHYLYVGNYNFHDKDHEEMLGTKILINMDEMGTLNRTDIESVKTATTKPIINLRRAWGKAKIFLFRKASFCGTINKEEFLTDMTGNRRWLPFVIKAIKMDERMNLLDKVYAQAIAEFKDGFQFYFDREEIKEVEAHNEFFRHMSMEEELLIVNYRKPLPEDEEEPDAWKQYNIKIMTTSDIVNEIASMDQYRKINVNDTMLKRFGQALKKMDFPRERKYIAAQKYNVSAWKVIKLTKEDGDKIRRGEEIVKNIPF